MPSEAVVPTLDGAVLTALARLTGPVTGRQVHQLAGVGSEAGVRKALTRLVAQGTVRASQAGSAWLYAVNREHVAWPAITALAGLQDLFLSRLRRGLEEWSLQARSVALFGSAARHDGTVDSDIDLLLVRQNHTHPDDPVWAEQIAQLKSDVAAWTGNHAQVYELDVDELTRHITDGHPIVDEWRRDALTLAGDDLRNLLRELGHGPHARSGR
ncbi:nucleotidyltransferase domain-containing protein [Jatrophihabitans sp.]|uniref:nucleotidyltransferase domain-containing protein n=1 Tax=Jatrophihabitans sp. TaxID=1932789 RepID=UPI002B8F0841|nr:nucleotidyltransferase domain-containing protein [Jatrophihabitans sp.]